MSFLPTSVPTKRLNQSINSSEMSFRLDDIIGWDGIALSSADFGTEAYCVFRNSGRTLIEIMEFDPSTIASNSITIIKRGLDFTGDRTTEVSDNKLSWTSGDTFVDLGTDTPQLWQWLKEYIDDATVTGLTQSGFNSFVATSNVSATESAVGFSEEATDAETTSGAATGGTGAKLFVTPAKLKSITGPVVRTYVVAGSPHTWSKPAGLKYVVVEVQAGGGGGEADGAGAGGGYSKKLIGVASLGSNETVTVGAAGGGSTTAATAGGNSSFGTHATANGGGAGTAGTPSVGGFAASGDINITGGGGNTYVNGDNNHDDGLPGGDSMFGHGGNGGRYQQVGGSATGYGSGGGAGGDSGNSGGAGAPGIVIVTEYYV